MEMYIYIHLTDRAFGEIKEVGQINTSKLAINVTVS